MNHSSEDLQILQSAIESLPKPKQEAVLWLMSNYDIAVSICKTNPLTASQRNHYLEDAIQKDNMRLLVLILLERIVNS